MNLTYERASLFFLGSCINRLQEYIDQVAVKFNEGINPGQLCTLGVPGNKGFENYSITLNRSVKITI